jgi:hypothetical protein
VRGGAKTGRWRTRVTIWVEANGGTGRGSSVAGGESMLRRDFGRSFAPLQNLLSNHACKNQRHPINGYPRAYYHMYPYISFADYKQPKLLQSTDSIFATGSAKQAFGGYSASVEHNSATCLHCDQACRNPQSLESHNPPRTASSRRQGRAL